MAKDKTTPKEPERFYVLGRYYVTKLSDSTYEFPQGLSDLFRKFEERRLGLEAMLESITKYVVSQETEILSERRETWDRVNTDLGLPIGTHGSLHFGHRVFTLEPSPATPPEKPGTARVHKPTA